MGQCSGNDDFSTTDLPFGIQMEFPLAHIAVCDWPRSGRVASRSRQERLEGLEGLEELEGLPGVVVRGSSCQVKYLLDVLKLAV